MSSFQGGTGGGGGAKPTSSSSEVFWKARGRGGGRKKSGRGRGKGRRNIQRSGRKRNGKEGEVPRIERHHSKKKCVPFLFTVFKACMEPFLKGLNSHSLENRIESPSPRLLKKCKTSSIIKTEKQKEKEEKFSREGKKTEQKGSGKTPGPFPPPLSAAVSRKGKRKKKNKKGGREIHWPKHFFL